MSGEVDDADRGWLGRSGRWLGLLLFLAVWLAPGLPSPSEQFPLSATGQRMAAVAVLMATLWATQGLPIAVTALLPLVMFPLLGIQSAKNTSQLYFNDSSFLYLGGFIVALGIERWGLHRRIALIVVSALGTTPKTIVLGFMAATAFISMWVSNTATTLLMLPIAVALLQTLEELQESTGDPVPGARADPEFARFAAALMLGVAYAASIGGVATPVGTPTNTVFVSIFAKEFPQAPAISAGQWILTWTPFAALFLLGTWQILVWGLGRPRGFDRFDRRFFRQRLSALGPMSRGEWSMLLVFAFTAIAWVTRTDLKLEMDVGGGAINLHLPGWGRLIHSWLTTALGVNEKLVANGEYINDSTVAVLMALLMFVIPAREAATGTPTTLITWAETRKIPWGVLLLFGGGFAIADGFSQSGLSLWMGEWIHKVATDQPVWLVVLEVVAFMVFLTEFTSNVATVNAVSPILASAAVGLQIDPRLIMVPAAVATSCGFMLPAGTPPNAIVFGTGRIRIDQMLRAGFLVNLLGIVLCTLSAFWLLAPQWGVRLNEFPDWAKSKAAAAPAMK